ncbi:FAD-dependent monooxygenase [Streptomyces sp. cmx-4-9]|uniref:FAD-dependent monooxygenase n=1 Tax=Streptomyces sp. cmx-4-9 TaxID=2790941 RepID=UPI0039812D79
MTDVVIAGSGPTGLTLACDLARRGAAVRVIEQRRAPHRESRGKGLDAASLQVLEPLGIAERMAATGSGVITLRKYFDGAHVRDTEVVGGLLIGQWRVEEVLRERLSEWGVNVEYGARLTGIDQNGSGLSAHLADGAVVRGRYLAGCDGGHSTVRELLGIPFGGSTAEEEVMALGDVTAPGLSREFWHQWFSSDGGGVLMCPIPGTEIFQFQASRELDEQGEPLPPSLESFQRLFDRHARVPGIRLGQATWLSAWRSNVRMASRLREGRVLLAGDAAHVHPIAGGLGMNTGIRDAVALGRALAAALGGPAGDRFLDTYESERLPVAAALLEDTAERMERVLAAVREPGRGTEAGLDRPAAD